MSTVHSVRAADAQKLQNSGFCAFAVPDFYAKARMPRSGFDMKKGREDV